MLTSNHSLSWAAHMCNKKAVQCALYMSALKVFETPDYACGYFSQIMLMHFCSDRFYECA